MKPIQNQSKSVQFQYETNTKRAKFSSIQYESNTNRAKFSSNQAKSVQSNTKLWIHFNIKPIQNDFQNSNVLGIKQYL